MNLRRMLQPLRRDQRGVSAVEFAFLAPILSVLIVGMIDFSSGISQRFTLQSAVNRSLEMVQANRVAVNAAGTADYSFLKQEVATAANIPLANVTLEQWLECNGAKQGSYTGTCADNTDMARYLELKATKPFRGKMFIKSITLTAKSAVRVQ
ncbi:MAG TPA: TadE/TadG family type IV pilus assembly protein [Allosphingosinicella sp.]|jgi:Flp pilus assembly protein TadG